MMPAQDPSPHTSVGPLKLVNPFLLESGPPTASGNQIRHAFRLGWAGAVTKTIVPDSMENREVSPQFAAWKGADAIELSVSCPHGMPERGVGAALGQHPDLVRDVTRAVRSAARVPLIVKLTPNVTDVLPAADDAAVEGGADILAAINTVQCLMGIDLDALEPLPAVAGSSMYGGYSGPATKPIGLRIIAQLAQNVSIPLIGIGGISRWQDAAEYIAVGASAVQVCTAVMWSGGGIIRDMNAGLSGYLAGKHFADVAALRGHALPRIGTHAALPRADVLSFATAGFPERCIACGRCMTACRYEGFGAISLESRHAVIDANRCDGGGLCSLLCPQGVIVMQQRARGG